MTNTAPKKRRMSPKNITIKEGELEIVQFTGKKIRKVCHNDEWYFSVVDAIAALTDTVSPRRYWFDLKVKLSAEGAYQLSDKIVQLKMVSADGKSYLTDAADVPTLLRIVQSIPSPKAEPLKRWLAQVGHASGRSLLFCSSTSALVGGDGPAAWELRAQAGPATVAESGANHSIGQSGRTAPLWPQAARDRGRVGRADSRHRRYR